MLLQYTENPFMKNLICCFTLLLLLPILTFAQPGSPDITFGTNGKVVTSVSAGLEGGGAIAVQNDGKVLVAGRGTFSTTGEDFVIIRYTTAGALDMSFDGDGIVTTHIGAFDIITSIVIQPDGKIVAAGYTRDAANNSQIVIARYTPTGILDLSFDGDGIVITSIGPISYASDLAIQSDGKIVVAGTTLKVTDYDFVIARYTTAGVLDISFDGDGIVTTDFSVSDDRLSAIAIQADGKIVVAGSVEDQLVYTDIALARYTVTGALDNTFDGDGIVTTTFNTYAYATDLTIQPDGKIVAAGATYMGSNFDFAVARYTINGALDNSFDFDGKVTTPIGTGDNRALSVALQADGKILVGGIAAMASINDFALVRYNADGALDNSFDTDGKTTLDFGGTDDHGMGIALFGNRIYQAGLINDLPGGFQPGAFALAAFNNDGLPLPLSLLSLTANKIGNRVQLNWQTTFEQNTASFITERSSDGRLFSSIGSVPAAGNSSSLRKYSFSDTKPGWGVNFYRLQMVDTDGQVKYSGVVKVNITGDEKLITVYPNPVTGNTISLQINDLPKGIYTVSVSNKTGQTVATKKINHTGGSASESVDFSKAVAAGVYHVRVVGEGVNITEEVIKR